MKNNIYIFIYLLILLILLLIQSCISDNKKIETKTNNTIIINKLVKNSLSLVGKKTYSEIIINDRKFILDCIGTVSAIYYGVGIDITKEFNRYQGNGVSRLYYYLKDKGLLHNKEIPDIGDVIFWDNTYDRNQDGIIGNDPLTHAGVVINIDKDGTICFIHAHYDLGIVLQYMNLKYPDVYKDNNGKEINTPLFSGSTIKNHPSKWLTGELWKQFGTIIE